MRAVVFESFAGPLVLRDVPEPVPPPGGVLVLVGASGVCRSDWHGWQGHDPGIALPHVPGHELAGTVVAVGTGVAGWRVGDRVTTPFACGCGACAQCAAGDQQVCIAQTQPGFTHWGSFAELVACDLHRQVARFSQRNVAGLPATQRRRSCPVADPLPDAVLEIAEDAGSLLSVLGFSNHSVGVQLVELGQALADARAPFVGKTLDPGAGELPREGADGRDDVRGGSSGCQDHGDCGHRCCEVLRLHRRLIVD